MLEGKLLRRTSAVLTVLFASLAPAHGQAPQTPGQAAKPVPPQQTKPPASEVALPDIPVPRTKEQCLNLRGSIMAEIAMLPEDVQRNLANKDFNPVQWVTNYCNSGNFQEAHRFAMAQIRTAKTAAGEIAAAPQAGKPGQKNCFLTTACCEVVGLADDCFELTQLRRFRDEVLVHMPGGREEISLYYATAPAVLAAMRRERNAAALARLYVTHILPCAIMVRLGLRRAALAHYRAMMVTLIRRYLA